jgi:uncharacterized membrane protein (DUF4010 family)
MQGIVSPAPADILRRVAIEELLSRIALSFGIGLLLGLERGWASREATPGNRAAGVRTFAITGLLGGIMGALARGGSADQTLTVAGAVVLGIAFATLGIVIGLFSRDENKAAGKHSATTAVAAMLTFALGAYAVLGNVTVAAASAVAATGVLALREGLHGWIEKITRRELESGLALLAMTFIALPVVPDRAIGPFGGVNPRDVWLIAIVLAAVSFAAYISVRYFGEKRGIVISALIGGLVSSTAVALSSARRAAAGEGAPATLAAATALATAVSFIRVLVLAGALQPSLVLPIAPALGVAALVAVGFAMLAIFRAAGKNGAKAEVAFRNPFGFWSVILIAVTMGVLIVAGRFIAEHFGERGTLLGAATMGLFDVDAMTVAMARLVPESLAVKGGALAILAGVATNTLTKVVIAAGIGRGRFAIDIAVVAAACIVGGGLALAGTFALARI